MSNITTVLDIIQVIVAILGFVTVTISLLYLAKQTKEFTKQNKSLEDSIRVQVYQSIASEMLEMDRVFIEYPELRPYFYDNVDISKKSKFYNRVEAAAEMKLDFYDTVLIQMQHFSASLANDWKEGVGYAFEKSPVLRSLIHKNKSWYTTKLVEIASESSNEKKNKSAG